MKRSGIEALNNKKTAGKLVFVAMVMGAPPFVSVGWAQSGDDTQALDTVTVTSEAITTQGDTPPPAYAGGQVAAGGRIGVLGEQDAMNVPFNVISYTSELIENQQADTLGDVLSNDASVSVGRGYGVYGESFKLRGFNLYGDDISYGGLYGVLPRQLIDTSMMQRVEVFKGASAFANGIPIGGSGVGGSVNIEPKRATEEPITRLSTGYTSDGYIESGLDAGRRFGDQNQFGARLSVKRGRGDHAIDDEASADTSAVLGLDYRGDRARASLDVGHQKNTINGARSSLYTGAGLDHIPHAPSSDINYTPDWAETHLETTFGMLRGEYDITDDWTAFAAIGGNKTHEYLASPIPTLNDSDGSATLGGVLPTRNEISTFAGQAGVRGHFDTGPISHQLNLAYSNFYRNFDTRYDYYTYGSATSIYDPSDIDEDDGVGGPLGGSVTHTRAEGTSLSDTLGFFDDRVLLTLGARYQEIHVNQEGDSAEERGHRVTPVYGLVFKATDAISLYANHIEALQSAGNVTDESAPNYGEALGISHSKQDEVGAKFDYGTFGGAIALFQIEQPSVATLSDGTQSLDNEQRNRGLELSGYGEPLTGVRVLASATFIDPELTKTQDDTQGNDAQGVPDYQYTLSGEWDIPHIDRLTATGRFLQTGSQYVAADNDLKLDSWSRLDLGVRYTMPLGQADWVWRVGVDNVTDEDYWASASTAGSGYITQGEPRTFKVSATVDF
ncbi:TonB-dependent receptor [Salinicola rhizosphaerae]|uniref:Ferrichrome receptor protein n=1 Tax=Salinicola rhizosphaerae TaxID=1443141 RepID=A0ABQ3E6C9_9GAMM|nr:TonB-dependent siderophore receptor [Salinicola rhizosphaerae]GHB23960.1 ferrichrome receptor protein [Salinicola rhizosphaerae]